jgi:hypothetical protein
MHNTIKISALQETARLERLIPEIKSRFTASGVGLPEIVIELLDETGYQTFFHGTGTRARCAPELSAIFVDDRKISLDEALIFILIHELCHILQSTRMQTISHFSWGNPLDVDFYREWTRKAYQIITDRTGLGKTVMIHTEEQALLPVSRSLCNICADIDVNGFIVQNNLCSLNEYRSWLEDTVLELKNQMNSNAYWYLERRYSEFRSTASSKKHLIASQSGAVFGESLHIVGMRWTKLHPISRFPGTDEFIKEYLEGEKEAYSVKCGRFYDKGSVEQAWNDLRDYDREKGRIWKAVERLAVNSVHFTKSVLSK